MYKNAPLIKGGRGDFPEKHSLRKISYNFIIPQVHSHILPSAMADRLFIKGATNKPIKRIKLNKPSNIVNLENLINFERITSVFHIFPHTVPLFFGAL